MLGKMYIAALSLAAVALGATTHEVVVGANGLSYEPDNVKAETGDTVNFTFKAGNHTVTQSTFAAPCVNAGLASGFRPAADPAVNTFSILINSTDPIWIYCSQGNHCQSGMVMAINAPDTGNKTLAAFKALAMGGGAASANSSGATGSTAASSAATGGTGGATSSTASGATAASATSRAQSSGTATTSGTSTRASSTQSSSSNGAGQIEPSVWGPMGLLLLSVVGLL